MNSDSADTLFCPSSKSDVPEVQLNILIIPRTDKYSGYPLVAGGLTSASLFAHGFALFLACPHSSLSHTSERSPF